MMQIEHYGLRILKTKCSVASFLFDVKRENDFVSGKDNHFIRTISLTNLPPNVTKFFTCHDTFPVVSQH
jgi:hypothetical protein